MGADDERLRVLFVNTATLAPLGADTWIHSRIIAALDRSTHELWAACAISRAGAPTPTYSALRDVPELQIVAVDFGPELAARSLVGKLSALFQTLAAFGSIVRLSLLVRRRRIPIIHTSDRPRDAFACVLMAKLTGAVCIVHVHVGYNGEWMGRMLRWSIRRADALVAVSGFVAATLVAAGHDPARTHVVLNAIDVDRWHPGVGRDAGRAEFGYPEGAVVIITVCRLFPEKGPADLIRALARVRQVEPDVHLLIVGAEMTPGFVAEMSDLVDDLGARDHVVLAGRRSDVATLMAAADIYAMPSLDEPFGLVFVEAMAMELPVVALANGGTTEVVEHGVTGLLSDHGDLDGLVENITTLVRDPVLRKEMGSAGRRRAEAEFTTARMARDVALLYRLLASSGHERPPNSIYLRTQDGAQ